MKKLCLILLVIAFAWQSNAKDLQVYYYYSPYYNTEVGTYIETYLTVIGNSLTFKKNEKGKYQAVIEVTMLFNQEGNVREFRKYNLKSPEIDDTLNKPNFLDLQRITIKEGIYNFEMKIKDLQTEGSKDYVFHDIVKISHNPSEIEISGVEYLEKYSPTVTENNLSRNGYDMVPYVADYFPVNVKNFTFYLEIYNTKNVIGESKDFLLKYYIEKVSSKEPYPNFVKTKKQKSADVIPLLGEFMIANLETGNYNFVVEVRNTENKLMACSKSFFQRSNPVHEVDIRKVTDDEVKNSFVEEITNKDTLIEYIHCLYPIWDPAENEYANNVIASDSIKFMQKFIYGFWKKRNFNNPQAEWQNYKTQVDYVNRMYSTQIKKGYQTQMGRVYLQYGAPNTVVSKHFSLEVYPYEMWHYWETGNLRNIRFVFFNPEITGKEFTLIHSTAKGEVYHDLWFNQLYRGDINTVGFNGKYNDYSKMDWYNEVMEDFRK